MANLANVAPTLSVSNAANVPAGRFVAYAANLDLVPVVLDTGATTVPNGGVTFRQPIAQPLTGSGPTLPAGPQWWPLTG